MTSIIDKMKISNDDALLLVLLLIVLCMAGMAWSVLILFIIINHR